MRLRTRGWDLKSMKLNLIVVGVLTCLLGVGCDVEVDVQSDSASIVEDTLDGAWADAVTDSMVDDRSHLDADDDALQDVSTDGPDAQTADVPTSDTAKPDAVLQDAGIADAERPDAAPLDSALPDSALPDAASVDARPDGVSPDAAVLDAERPDAAPLDSALPDSALPDAASVDARPDGVSPDAAVLDAESEDAATDMEARDVAIPDVAELDAALADQTLADAALLDMAQPDMALPDMALPDMALPDMAQPDMAPPDMALPDAAAPAPFECTPARFIENAVRAAPALGLHNGVVWVAWVDRKISVRPLEDELQAPINVEVDQTGNMQPRQFFSFGDTLALVYDSIWNSEGTHLARIEDGVAQAPVNIANPGAAVVQDGDRLRAVWPLRRNDGRGAVRDEFGAWIGPQHASVGVEFHAVGGNDGRFLAVGLPGLILMYLIDEELNPVLPAQEIPGRSHFARVTALGAEDFAVLIRPADAGHRLMYRFGGPESWVAHNVRDDSLLTGTAEGVAISRIRGDQQFFWETTLLNERLELVRHVRVNVPQGAADASTLIVGDTQYIMWRSGPLRGRVKFGWRAISLTGTNGCDCEPVEEICNGLDDDCDGVADEVQPLNCEAGLGVCRGTGIQRCRNGVLSACLFYDPARPPAPESCNGTDDDCDGIVDEDCLCGGGQFRCGDDTCISGCGICDGFGECPDGEDEFCEFERNDPGCLDDCDLESDFNQCPGFCDRCEQSAYLGQPVTRCVGQADEDGICPFF